MTPPDSSQIAESVRPGSIAGLFAGRVAPMPGDGRPTAIFKQPLTGLQAIGPEGLSADAQADRQVHGGPEKALHQFSGASLRILQAQFPELASAFIPGTLGENLSEALMSEASVRIGDVYQIGSAKIQVCQPRTPCWKVDAKFGQVGIASFMMRRGISGWYYRVLETGHAQVGDSIQLLERCESNHSIESFWALVACHRPAIEDLEAARAQPGLAHYWVNKISGRLDWLRKNSGA